MHGLLTGGPSIGSLDEIPAEDVAAVRRFREQFSRDAIPYRDFQLTFHRSSGAGGQNVNKVNTKVYMRFELAAQSWLPRYVRERLREDEAGRINARGEYLVTSEKTRSQRHNIDDCLDKLWQQIDRAATLPAAPSEATAARVRALQAAGRARDMASKKRRSDRKASRRAGPGEF